VPALLARHASNAPGEVNAKTWVRPSVVQVPHPVSPVAPNASAATGSKTSPRARMRKYCSWSLTRKASRMAISASVAGSQSLTATPSFGLGTAALAKLTYKAAAQSRGTRQAKSLAIEGREISTPPAS
jgi:hypothetical protein